MQNQLIHTNRSSLLRGTLVSLVVALAIPLAAAAGCGGASASLSASTDQPEPEPEPEPEPVADSDGDGINDDVDMCPDVAGVANTRRESRHGCPERRRNWRARFERNRLVIDEKIMFATNSAEISEDSATLLDEIAETIKEAGRRVKLIEIAGHADERGKAEVNVALTGERSGSVVAALVERGVDESKLRGMGYGSYCPLEPGNHDANRRVEFVVLKGFRRATGAQTGCEAAAAAGIQGEAVTDDPRRRRRGKVRPPAPEGEPAGSP
jgi:outer membrane protein OmpA-like peptidoglycan-associated protein